jgi:heme/copper-type cytochrome/quinol oxidase subunit 4
MMIPPWMVGFLIIIIVAVIAFAVVAAESCLTRLIVFYPFQFLLSLTWVNMLILFLIHMRCPKDMLSIYD